MEPSRSFGEGAARNAWNPGAIHPALMGFQVLLVEDEALVSAVLESMLIDLGCEVAGVAASVGEATRMLQSSCEPDAAVLDVNLGGEKVFPVADILMRRGVPFVFSTGYGPADLAQRYPDSPLLHKPYSPGALADVLSGFVEIR